MGAGISGHAEIFGESHKGALMEEMKQLLEFLKEADRLKLVERQTLIHSGGRRENSAEHSWHLALAALVFGGRAPDGLDMLKALKMALLHDLVEIDAGDEIVYGANSQKKEKEAAAIERLTKILPTDTGAELKTVWEEFEQGESPEAKYVAAIDRFLPIFSNYLNEGHSWKNHSISSARVIARCEGQISQIPGLWRASKEMLEECIEKGHLLR